MKEKIINYYKVFGLKETIKKIFRYTNIKIKTRKDGSYIFSKLEKRNIIMKPKNAKTEFKKYYDNISIIILNYNNKGIIDKCLDSLIKYKGKYKYEIIVVDNLSSDGSYEMLTKKYNNIKIYRNTKNGCASGRNLGVKKSSKEYIMFLDSDQFIKGNDWIDNYLTLFNIDQNIGAIGWTGGWFNKKGYAFHTVDNFEFRYMPPGGMARKDIGYLGSGGMFMKRSIFNKIGGFDVNYDPTCYEDTDISLKIRNVGKELYYCPFLNIEHDAHQTTKSGSDKHEKLIQEKGKYFVNKWKNINPSLLKYRK